MHLCVPKTAVGFLGVQRAPTTPPSPAVSSTTTPPSPAVSSTPPASPFSPFSTTCSSRSCPFCPFRGSFISEVRFGLFAVRQTTPHCTALHCAALHCAALRCTTPFSTAALTSSDSGSILCIAAAAAVLGLTKRRRTARWRARSLKDPFSRSARALARSRSRSVARVLALKRTSDRARRSRPRTRPRRGDRAVPRSGTYPACGRAGFRCFFPDSLLAVCFRAGARTN